ALGVAEVGPGEKRTRIAGEDLAVRVCREGEFSFLFELDCRSQRGGVRIGGMNEDRRMLCRVPCFLQPLEGSPSAGAVPELSADHVSRGVVPVDDDVVK